jgi:23S rRNA (cytidine1920-2'-O)/16S rRNA (cytidine1409-2'-O)-methyltransferase
MTFAAETGFHILGLDYSPIKGPEGNIEYLLYMQKETGKEQTAPLDLIGEVAAKAHGTLS